MARFDKNRFRTENQSWETPQELFNLLNEEFSFDVDLAGNKSNAKCPNFISKEQDALKQEWNGVCWLNHPYGGNKENSLKNWVKKSYEESRKGGCIVVMLIPARTNTEWWHEYCMKAKEIRLVRGRPKFKGNIHGLPQPLAIIIFSNESENPILKSQNTVGDFLSPKGESLIAINQN